MKKVISITDMWGNSLPLDKMEVIHADENNCLARYKGFGITKNYRACDGYTVITEKVEA